MDETSISPTGQETEAAAASDELIEPKPTPVKRHRTWIGPRARLEEKPDGSVRLCVGEIERQRCLISPPGETNAEELATLLAEAGLLDSNEDVA